MNELNSVLLVGAGAVGSAVAHKLHDTNPGKVFILAGGERANRYRQQGLMINEQRYDLPILEPVAPVLQAGTPQKMLPTQAEGSAIPLANAASGPIDLILVAVKQYDLASAIEDMRCYVGEHTVILSLMNGITSEAELGEAFGSEKILYGLVIGIDGNRSGNRVRFTSAGTVVFGEAENCTWSDRVSKIAQLFDAAGVTYTVPENMLHALWYKFMINVGINQVSAVLLAPYGVFQLIPAAEDMVEDAMREVNAVAMAKGIELGETDITNWRTVLASMNPETHTSMVDDLLHGRPTEIEMLSGTVIQLGAENNIPTPVNELLYKLIRTREEMAKIAT